jgi:hypothetical protein
MRLKVVAMFANATISNDTPILKMLILQGIRFSIYTDDNGTRFLTLIIFHACSTTLSTVRFEHIATDKRCANCSSVMLNVLNDFVFIV